METDALDQARQYLEALGEAMKETDARTRAEMGRIPLETLRVLREDMYRDQDWASLEVVTNHVIADKLGLLEFIQAKFMKQTPDLKEAACEQLAQWLQAAQKERLELDPTYLRKIRELAVGELRNVSNSAKMREKCGEALKIVTVVLASVAQAGGALERAAEEEKDLAYDKTLFQNLLQDLKTAKSTESVKVLGVTMCILGEIHRQHAAVIGAWVREYEWKGKMQSENLQEQFLEYLKNKLNYFDGDKKESGELVSGYLEAVRGSLTGSSQKAADHGGFLQTVYRKVAKILRDSENMHRYKVVEAALDLLKEHAGHFREFFLSDSKEESPATIYDVLLRLCVHVNKEVKTSALEATDAWLGQVASMLNAQDQHLKNLWKICAEKLQDERTPVRCTALRGIGALAKAREKIFIAKFWKSLPPQISKMLVQIETEEGEDAQRLLPDLVVSLADVILQLPVGTSLSDSDLGMLDNLCGALLEKYATALNVRRFLFERAFYFLLYALHTLDVRLSADAKGGDGRALSLFLERAVYRNIIFSVLPELSSGFSPPGVPAVAFQKPQPCVRFARFWASIGQGHNDWLRRRAAAVDLELEAAHKAVQQQVYGRVWQAIIRIVSKLDFSFDTDAAKDGESADAPREGQVDKDDDEDEAQGAHNAILFTQASGMTGRERPRSTRDVHIFLNLVDFSRMLLDDVEPEFFKDSCHVFCETVIRLASRHTLFSGFFKLLTAAMKSARQGHFFRGLSLELVHNPRNSSGVGPRSDVDDMDVDGERECRGGARGDGDGGGNISRQSNIKLCFIVTSKFAREMLARTESCFDDLLVAMLETILVLPREMRDLSLQVPALKLALKLGVNYDVIAKVALDSLEEWVEDSDPHLHRYLYEILPLLEVYFRPQEQGEGSTKGAISIDKKDSQYKYQMRKKAGFRTRKKGSASTSSQTERKSLALRAVKLLGKLGSDERWLAGMAEKEAFETCQLNTTQALLKLKDFTFGNSGQDVTPAVDYQPSLDCVLPRVMFLAESSVDRQTKVASCELLHALVTAAIGFHAQAPEDKYKKLLASILPCVLRLAVDGDPVSFQLFQPLIMQMIHWYTTKERYVEVAEALLNAVLGGIESQDNGKLREASSQFLAEFVRWTLKGLTDPRNMEDPKSVKSLLYRVYGLLNHPSATKRLGAYLAVKQLASVLKQNARNHSAIVDQFLLELLHNGIMSLRLCQLDEPSMGTEKSAVDALDKLGRLMRLHNPGSDARTFAELFKEPRVSSKGLDKRPRRSHEDLESFAAWVYSQVALHEKPARRYCMKTLPPLAKLLHKDGPKGWVVAKSSGERCGFAARFEDNLLSQDPIDKQPLKNLTARYGRLETALDVYTWLLQLDYARPSHLFKEQASDVAESFGQFVEQSEREVACLFPTATPNERRKHALQKSRCIYAELKLVHMALSTYDSKEHKAIPQPLVSPQMLRMLVLCLLAPGSKLGLDELGDPVVDLEIPRMFKQFCFTLRQKSTALWERLQAAVTDVLSSPDLELGDLQRTLESVGSDSFAMLLRGHIHLSDAQLAVGQGEDAGETLFEKGVKMWLWEVHFKEKGEFEPSFKALAHSLLQVALRRLKMPKQVWGLFSGLNKIERWRESPDWAFYLELREQLDPYVAQNTNLLKQFLLPQIGKVNREYITSLLCNVIDSQFAVSDSAETGGGGNATRDDVATVCMDLDDDRKEWVDFLIETKETKETKGDGGRALPSWAATQEDYDYDRRKSAVEVLGKLLLLIWRRKEAAGAGAGGLATGSGVHRKIQRVLARVLEKEKDSLKDMRSRNRDLDGDMLVRLFETLTHFLRLATAAQAQDMVENVENTLLEGFPDDIQRMTPGQKSFYIPVFTALLKLVRESRSRFVLPLVRKFLLTEADHDFKISIRDALNEFVLQMPDQEALETALRIVRASQDQQSLNPNVLRVERSVVDQVCGRILNRLEPNSLIAFFCECLPLLLRALKIGGTGTTGPQAEDTFRGNMAAMNQLICMLIVLESIYPVTSYADIKANVDTKVTNAEIEKERYAPTKEFNLTLYLFKRLDATRKLRLSSEQQRDNNARDVFTVMVQHAMSSYATIVCHTQSKPNPFKTIFDMKSTDWLNVVGDTPPTFAAELGGAGLECIRCKRPEENHFGPSKFCNACVFPERSSLREGRLEESGDDNSTLRRQHHQRSAVSSTLSGSLRSQVGSLSQDLSSMPRTLLGDALTADGGAPGVAPADRVSEDVLLVEHDFNCNQAMRAVIKTLFVIQEKQLGPADGNMPPWMQEFFKTLTLKDTDFRVQLFLIKVLVNYHKNLRRMEAAGRPMQDMFQPFADRFFEVFFNKDNGIAPRLCGPGIKDARDSEDDVKFIQKMQKNFSYFLKDICSLWESWILPKYSATARGFKISEGQGRHGWAFINSLTSIAINESSQEANDNIFYLRSLIRAWRWEAKTGELDDCVLKGFGKYLAYYNKLQKAKAEKEDSSKVKILEVAVRTGLSLLLQFLEQDLTLHTEVSAGNAIRAEFISNDALKKVLKLAISMMQPDTHKNLENRKYNKFFKHAAEVAGQVLQCIRNSAVRRATVGGDGLSDEETLLKKQVEKIDSESKGDQLVTALGGICSGYARAGKMLYKHALPHLNMSGVLLNSVQQVLISYTACLLQDKAATMNDDAHEEEEEKKGKELVKELMPKLALWLKRPDPRTQKFTLQLLTGRDIDKKNTAPPGAGGVAAANSSCRGLLEFMDEETFANDVSTGAGGGKRGAGLMACIRSEWQTFTSKSGVKEVRQAFYCMLQDVCDHKNYWAREMLEELRSILVVGLGDSDEDVRQNVFDWWHHSGLSKCPHDRITELFRSLRPHHPRTVDEQWLGNSVGLLLQLCRDSASSEKLLFDKDLQEQAVFTKVDISTASTAGSLPLATPMFASSLAISQAAASMSMSLMGAGSQSQSSAGGGQGDVMATLQGSQDGSGGGGTMMTLDSTREYLAEQTLQANDTALFVPRRKDVPRPAALGAMGGGTRRLGAFAMPRTKSSISKGPVGEERNLAMARLRENQREMSERSKQNRARRVRMAREYRSGEIPDIKIKLQDIVKPLQELAMRDSVVSKMMLNVLFKAVLELQGDDAEKNRNTMKDQITEDILKMLGTGRSSDLMSGVLALAQTAQIKIDASKVAEACERTKAFYDGIKALELQAAAEAGAAANRGSKKRTGGSKLSLQSAKKSATVGGASQIPPPGAQKVRDDADDWKQLALLYKQLEESDIVRGLYDKFSEHPDTKKALMYELEGRYCKARETYDELLLKCGEVEDGTGFWDPDPEPSDLEKDLWEDGKEEAMQKTCDWQELDRWIKLKVEDEFEDNIWLLEHRRLLKLHFRQLIGSCSMSAARRSGGNEGQGGDWEMTNEWREYCQMIDEVWFGGKKEKEAAKIILQQDFPHETALALLANKTPERVQAKELINGAMNHFLADWSASSESGQVARRSKIRFLQKVVELSEYNEASESVDKWRQLIRLWGTRLPSKAQLGDVESWDAILVSRLMLLRRMSINTDLADDANATLGATYLALSSLARRRGNYTVADRMLACCRDTVQGQAARSGGRADDEMAKLLKMRSVALKLALAKARDASSGEQETALDARKLLESEDAPICEADCSSHTLAAHKTFRFLSGEVYALQGGAGGDYSKKARDEYEEALKVSRLQHARAESGLPDHSGTHRKDAKIHVAFAAFCDAQIRAGAGRAGTDGEQYAAKYMENLLAAIEKGSAVAQENFPRSLELLANAQHSKGGAASVRRKWAEGCSRVPSSAIIKWLPQLISHFKHCAVDERECVLQVLLQLNADYPQAIYMAVRVLKHEVPGLWKKLAAPSGGHTRNSKIELFCCAVRHLQHPEHQLKDLKNVADINQVHESIFQELCADFGPAADRSDVLGDYRKTLNSKINSALRSKLDEKMPADCIKLFKDLSEEGKMLSEKIGNKSGKVQVTRFSRALHGLEGSGTDSIVIPGQHLAATPVRNEEAAPKLGSCDSELRCMESKALPKRLIMRGSDGKEYWWLVKGGEDLRQDERLQQVFSSINRILASDVKCSQRRLRLETYACIPVSMTSGLLEWVQDTMPLQDYSAHDEASRLRYKRLHGGGGKYQAYVNAFKDGNIKDGNSIEQGFDELLQDIPGDRMRWQLMSNQSSAQAQYLLRANFAKSLAAMNASHYLMGIGDRHDGNTLVSNRGLLVGIDFGMAFGKATWVLPVPELVPFRLTKQMLGVLSPLDSAALLKRSMTCVLSALRANKQMLIQNLSIFLDDPTMDWLVDSKTRQGLNLEAEDGGGEGGGRAAKTSAGTPVQPRQAVHPAKTSAGDGSFLQDRMQVLREKLNGKHPCEVMKIDIKSSKVQWVKENELNIAALLDRVGSVKSNRPGAISQQPSLSAADQTEALVRMATHTATLSRIWEGWAPWK